MSKYRKKQIQTSIPLETMEQGIFLIRGKRVMLDADLAKIYGVPTKRFNEQIKRNLERFPADFAFQLTREEAALRSQFATSKMGRGGRRYLPYAFTEHGAIMAANVLNSPRAVAMSVYVVRAFVRMKEIFVANQILEDRLSEIEKVLLEHNAALYDIYKKIKPLLFQPRKNAIGFQIKPERTKTDAVGFSLKEVRIGKISEADWA